MFLSILQVHGYAAISVGDIVKIVPDSKAKQSPIPVVDDDFMPADQLVRRVIPLTNTPAEQLIPILEPIVAEGGLLAVFPAANALVITDRSSNIDRIVAMIQLIDKPDNNEVEVIPVSYASASDIVQTLSPLQRAGTDVEYSPNQMQIFPDIRSNSVLVSGSTAVRSRVRRLIKTLDKPTNTIGGSTRVISLRFAIADDMAQILRGTFDAAEVGINDFDSEAAYFERGLESGEDIPFPPPQNSSSDGVNIQTDEATNSLIVSAPPDDMRAIMRVIEELDVRQPQVLVSAIIAEVTEDNLRELGANFFLDSSVKSGPVGYTNLGGATPSINERYCGRHKHAIFYRLNVVI